MDAFPIGLGSVVCLALLAAQPPVQQTAEKITVEGAVVDAATGLPIERALVSLGPQSQFTGPDGRFSFPDQPNRGYFPVLAIRPGYEHGRGALEVGAPRQALTVKLKRYAEITGKVLNEDGEPVQGLRVQAYRRQIESGRPRLAPSSFWTTDDLGHFRLGEMPAGNYLVRVMARHAVMPYLGERSARAVGVREAYQAQYYPGVADESAAQVLKMEPGQALQIDFTISSRLAVSVRGRVSNQIPYQPVTLQLGRPGELAMGNRIGINAVTGDFEIFDVPPGQYELRARRTVNGTEERGRAAIQVGNVPVDGVSLMLAPAATIEVRKQGVEAVPGQVPFLVLKLFRKGVTSDEEQFIQAMPGRSGSESLSGVWPGEYRVRVQAGTAEQYVGAVTSGNIDLLRDGLTVVEGLAPAPIDVQLVPGAARLSVAVLVDGKPAPSGQVLLLGDTPESAILSELNEGREEHIEFPGLAPGTYSVLAVPAQYELEYGNPQLMQRFESRVKRITLRAGASETIQVELAQEAEH